MAKKIVSIAEAAQILSVSLDTIRRWEKKGLIKGTRDSSNVRIFDVAELKRAHSKYIGGNVATKFKVLKTTKKTKFKTVELFAGAGGLALGLENAGLNHELLVEIDKNAAATLKSNRPKWNIECKDARDTDYKKIKADIVTGGFPCQAFSFAGKKLGFEDARGTLFFELARAVKEIKPKIAVGENVKGLLRHENGRTLSAMIDIMDELGYRVVTRVLRAQYLDVPQKRERLIILCVRKDLKLPFIFPRERDYTISLRDALQKVPISSGQEYPTKKQKILELIPPGGYWKDLPDTLQREYMGASYFMGGGKTGMARRLSWDEPSLTLTCAPAQKQTERCHPEETRPLTVREYARIQSFPDSWDFIGATASQYKQIGNAVPVNLGYHLGRCLIAMLDGSYEPKTMQYVTEEESLNFKSTLAQIDLFEDEPPFN
jgi:DNA (cytosine-5)-methyltransferase 1